MPVLEAISLHSEKDIRQSTVLDLDTRTVRQLWPRAIQGTERALNYLVERCGVQSRDWLPYREMLISLSSLAIDIDPNSYQSVFWSRSFSLAYDVAANTRIVTDYTRLVSAIENSAIIEAPPASATALLTATRRTQRPLCAAFLCALSAHGATDLLGAESNGLVMAPPLDEASIKLSRDGQLVVSVFPRHYSERYAQEGMSRRFISAFWA
jgi:hypothetical protein